MRLFQSSVCAFAVLGFLAGNGFAQSVRDSIETANAAFVKAYNAKDAAAVAAMYDEEAAVLPSNDLRVDGRANIQKFWQGGIDYGFTALTLSTTEAQSTGEWAYEVGNYTAKYPDKSGKMLDDIGKYVVIWKKSADGNWRLYRDIWNSDPVKSP